MLSAALVTKLDVHLKRWLPTAACLAAALSVTHCVDQSGAPSGTLPGSVALLPRFATDADLAALNLPIDRFHLVLVRQPDDTVADTLVAFSIDSDSLRLVLTVPLEQPAESLEASIELLGGSVPLFSGSRFIEVRRGGTSSQPIPVVFVGPGANVATVRIAPRDTFLLLGDAFQFQLAAHDAQGQPVIQFYASWSTPAGPLVNALGLFRAPGARGNTVLRVQLPNGIRDSTRVWFVPSPTSLALVSGTPQSGPIGTLLGAPLVVRVVGQDGLGVGGVPVRFRGLVGGGVPSDSLVVSDSLGLAQTEVTLGTVIGSQSIEASATGLDPVVFNLTGTAGIPVSIAANSPVTQAATVVTAVASPPSVIVHDALGNPVPGVTVTFAVIAGDGTILPASAVTSAAGIASLTSWVLGAVAGTGNNVVEASVTGLTGSPVRFTASGLAGPVARLALSTQPSATGIVGVALAQQPVAQLQDAQGNNVTGAGTVVTAAIATSPGGTPSLVNPTATTVTNGQATFAGLSIIGLVGNYTLNFSATGLTPAVSSSIALAVGAVSTQRSSVAAAPAQVLADSADAATVTVTARDAGNNPVPGAAVTIQVSGTGNSITQPTLPTNTTGVATGRFVTIVPEGKTVSATAAGVAITQTAAVVAAAPPRIVFSGDSLGGGPPLGVFRVNPNGTVRVNVSTLGGDGLANPRLSPDGTRVLFTAPPVGSFTDAVHIAAADGSVVATVQTDSASAFPRWNRDATHLAFECSNFGFVNRNVCVVPNVNVPFANLVNKGNGAGKIVLTEVVRPGAGGPSAFAWDPANPNRLAIVRDTILGGNRVGRLFFTNFDGSNASAGTLLVLPGDSIVVQEMAWAPNGTFLILAAEKSFQRRLYRINSNGTGLTQLTNPTPGLEDSHPAISPDNTQVLFLRNSLDFEGSIWNYFVMPVAGPLENVAQVSAEAASFLSSQMVTGDWSPDGSQFVLVGTDVTTVGVYVMPSTTRAATYLLNRRRISGGLNRTDGSPSWR